MKAAGKAMAIVAVAATLFVVGGIGLIPTPSRDEAGSGAAVGVPPTAALVARSGSPGSLESSIASLQERVRDLPGDWRGYASLGLAYVAQARVSADPSYYPKAEGALRRSLRINDRGNVDAVLGLGALALARHDFEAALELGRRAAALSPSSADVYGVIGDAQLELGRYGDAFETFQTMVDTRPGLSSYARASYARELMGDVPGAIEAMRIAFGAAGSPSDAAWVASRLGDLSWGTGDVREAATWYRRGRSLAPAAAANEAGLAKVAWARGNLDDAIRRYTDVVARYPAAEYLTALGDLYAKMGRLDLARQQYAVVQATADLAAANGVDVELELALFFADHGDPAAALAAAEAVWARRRGLHVADAYAWALYANDRFEEAARLSDRARELGTRDATILFHAGMIRFRLGDVAAARRLLRAALNLNPHFSILHVATARRVLRELGAS